MPATVCSRVQEAGGPADCHEVKDTLFGSCCTSLLKGCMVNGWLNGALVKHSSTIKRWFMKDLVEGVQGNDHERGCAHLVLRDHDGEDSSCLQNAWEKVQGVSSKCQTGEMVGGWVTTAGVMV